MSKESDLNQEVDILVMTDDDSEDDLQDNDDSYDEFDDKNDSEVIDIVNSCDNNDVTTDIELSSSNKRKTFSIEDILGLKNQQGASGKMDYKGSLFIPTLLP